MDDGARLLCLRGPALQCIIALFHGVRKNVVWLVWLLCPFPWFRSPDPTFLTRGLFHLSNALQTYYFGVQMHSFTLHHFSLLISWAFVNGLPGHPDRRQLATFLSTALTNSAISLHRVHGHHGHERRASRKLGVWGWDGILMLFLAPP